MLNSFPDELLVHIFAHLDPDVLVNSFIEHDRQTAVEGRQFGVSEMVSDHYRRAVLDASVFAPVSGIPVPSLGSLVALGIHSPH